MTLEEVVKKAKYIQFPFHNTEYKDLYEDKNPIKLPIINDKEVLYTGMPKDNSHHYTTDYTHRYVLPTIGKLFDFPFSLNDFNLIEIQNGVWDVSYIKPKRENKYTITCFDNGHKVNGGYEVLLNPEFFNSHLYRELYRYPHRCSRVVNETIKSDRKLMISGDSQIIPAINPLTNYFKEVWYFDNRTGYIRDKETKEHKLCGDLFKSFSYTYKDVEFTDVLIECYSRGLDWYEYWNLQ